MVTTLALSAVAGSAFASWAGLGSVAAGLIAAGASGFVSAGAGSSADVAGGMLGPSLGVSVTADGSSSWAASSRVASAVADEGSGLSSSAASCCDSTSNGVVDVPESALSAVLCCDWTLPDAVVDVSAPPELRTLVSGDPSVVVDVEVSRDDVDPADAGDDPAGFAGSEAPDAVVASDPESDAELDDDDDAELLDDDDDAELLDDDDDEDPELEPVSSANAVPGVTNVATPRAAANAPMRPTCRAYSITPIRGR